jgi:glycerol-3-phosphate dehydrogenase
MARMQQGVGELGGHYDLLVVGGGINGCGIARDAAGRGWSVLLCEQHDLAAHTSSASTKLIHGGLRYLEQLHFALVRKSLKERETLLASAPHIMWPMRFVMPYAAHLRPAWVIRAGLYLYDHLAARKLLPASAGIDLRTHIAGASLAARYRRGFVYSDGWVDDARLVVLTALDAAERGATILTRTRCERLERSPTGWTASLVEADGRRRQIGARAVVNATGAWVAQFLHAATPAHSKRNVRLVKGSHIAVRRLYEHRFAYLFQNPDRRVVFALPYERDFTLIGTTDVDYEGDPAAVSAEPAEIDYLCAAANQYFVRQITPRDVIWRYSGVRPLLDDESRDPTAVTRDYALDVDGSDVPILSVFGGKITTYRRLGQEAVNRLAASLQRDSAPWTASALLPGGDLPAGGFAVFSSAMGRRYPWLGATLRQRYARAYGTRIDRLLQGARGPSDLGVEVLPGLYARELEYLWRHEWARTAEDVLWRRSKLGLHLAPESAATLDAWMQRHLGTPAERSIALSAATSPVSATSG